MLEGLICPVCENTIEEIDLKESLKCPNCSVDLKNRKYLDFLEFLMANGIVENLAIKFTTTSPYSSSSSGCDLMDVNLDGFINVVDIVNTVNIIFNVIL